MLETFWLTYRGGVETFAEVLTSTFDVPMKELFIRDTTQEFADRSTNYRVLFSQNNEGLFCTQVQVYSDLELCPDIDMLEKLGTLCERLQCQIFTREYPPHDQYPYTAILILGPKKYKKILINADKWNDSKIIEVESVIGEFDSIENWPSKDPSSDFMAKLLKDELDCDPSNS